MLVKNIDVKEVREITLCKQKEALKDFKIPVRVNGEYVYTQLFSWLEVLEEIDGEVITQYGTFYSIDLDFKKIEVVL